MLPTSIRAFSSFEYRAYSGFKKVFKKYTRATKARLAHSNAHQPFVCSTHSCAWLVLMYSKVALPKVLGQDPNQLHPWMEERVQMFEHNIRSTWTPGREENFFLATYGPWGLYQWPPTKPAHPLSAWRAWLLAKSSCNQQRPLF